MLWTALVLSMLCGCAKPPAESLNGMPPKFSMQPMSLEEEAALDQGKFRLDPIATSFLVPLGRTNVLAKLAERECLVKTAVLRNPGAMLVTVYAPDGTALSTGQQLAASAFAKGEGLTLLNGRIPYRFGPDGQTPILMRNAMTYLPASEAQIVPMNASLRFKDERTAQQAAKYLDSAAFQVKCNGQLLVVEFEGPVGSATDETVAFESFANRWGGDFLELGSERQLP